MIANKHKEQDRSSLPPELLRFVSLAASSKLEFARDQRGNVTETITGAVLNSRVTSDPEFSEATFRLGQFELPVFVGHQSRDSSGPKLPDDSQYPQLRIMSGSLEKQFRSRHMSDVGFNTSLTRGIVLMIALQFQDHKDRKVTHYLWSDYDDVNRKFFNARDPMSYVMPSDSELIQAVEATKRDQ